MDYFLCGVQEEGAASFYNGCSPFVNRCMLVGLVQVSTSASASATTATTTSAAAVSATVSAKVSNPVITPSRCLCSSNSGGDLRPVQSLLP